MTTFDDRRESLEVIRAAYDRRTATYAPTDPWVCRVRQERERALVDWLRQVRPGATDTLSCVELGCGTGTNLLDFLRLGFDPRRLVGVELLEDRVAAARRLLPEAVRVHCGDAAQCPLEDGSFDVVFQSMMCTSILDDRLLGEVASRMWRLAKPGGGVLWYDFTYDNPANPDVRGLPLRRVRSLFPGSGTPRVRRVTLAPPIARRVTAVHPALYTMLNVVPWLRTHVLAWFPKPA